MAKVSAVSVGIIGMLVVGIGGGSVAVASSLPEACETPAVAGKASELVRVTDGTAEAPSPIAVFPTPLITSGTERSVVREGSGIPAVEGSAVDFHVAAYLGSSGQFLTASSFLPDEPVRRSVSAASEDYFARALVCSQGGDRLVITDTISAVFGEIPEDDLVQNDSTVVLVVDVLDTYIAKADGFPMWLQDGAPTVVQHPDGHHGVSLPMGPPPSTLGVYTLKRGEGVPLKEGDDVVAHYTALVWETRQVFSSSFDQNIPLTIALFDGSQEGVSEGIINGLYEGLVGQTVGSQVAIVVPPDRGYPVGGQPAGVPDGSTLVYVFDILGAN